MKEKSIRFLNNFKVDFHQTFYLYLTIFMKNWIKGHCLIKKVLLFVEERVL